jgi:type II secretory pathway pseudopilin PulG
MRTAPVTPRVDRPLAKPRVSVRRQGITLLEVVVSLAIFLFSIVAIGYLSSTSSERAYQTLQQTLALQLCQAKLGEAAQGVIDLDNVPSGYNAYDSSDTSAFKDFEWKIESSLGDLPDLYNVQVWVQRDKDGKHVEVTLSQRIFSPKKRGSSADKLPADPTATPDSGTQSGTMMN